MAFQDWVKGAAAKAAELAKQAAADLAEKRRQAALEAALSEQRAATARAETLRQAAAQRAEEEALQQRMAELRAQIDARWPPAKFPRVPPALLAKYRQDYPGGVTYNLEEDLPNTWARMLQEYPAPPEDDDERKAREEKFWRDYLLEMTVTKADGAVKSPTRISGATSEAAG